MAVSNYCLTKSASSSSRGSGRSDRQAGRHTDRQTDRQEDRQTDFSFLFSQGMAHTVCAMVAGLRERAEIVCVCLRACRRACVCVCTRLVPCVESEFVCVLKECLYGAKKLQ